MRATLTICLLLLLAAPVSAQAKRDTAKVDSTHVARAFRVEGVTVQVPRPGLTTGGSSAVTVELDSLGAIPAPTMEQVLRQMPFIQIRTNSRGEAQPALRGSEDRQIAVLMDGVPLTLGWDHRTDLSIIPLTAARNVTLLRGLSSVLYGPNTLGGVVEVDVARTRQRVRDVDPLVVGMSLDETGGTSVSATGGALLERPFSPWVVRGGVGFQDRPGFTLSEQALKDPQLRTAFLADDDLRLNSDSRRADGFLSARYLADSGRWMSLAASGYDAERGVPPEAHQDGPRLWRYPDQRRLIAAVSGGTGLRETRWGSGDLEASVGIDVGAYRIDAFETEAYASVAEREEADDRTVTLRLLGDHTVGPSGEIRAALTFADVSHDEVLTPGGASQYGQRLWSLGTETEWRLGGGGNTRLTAGVVLDGADTPESGDKPPLDRLYDVGFRAGISSLVRDGVSLHGGVSRRARFPSLRELYSGALGRFEPNPDLRPEKLWGGEGGVTVHTGDGEFQAVVFHHRLTNGIIRTSIVDEIGNRKFKRINQNEIRSTGLELLAVGTVGPALLTGDLTLQHVHGHEADGTKVDLEYEPSVAGKAGLEVPVPAGARAVGQLRYMGEQRCANPETGGLQPLKSSRSVDLSLRRLFSGSRTMRSVDASISVRNVTDALVFDQCGLPQPGRTFQIQLRIW
ncbi:MAG: TonB-dependent receptor [Gemmatimonadota bacterium]